MTIRDFVIYHVPNRKVGCTANLTARYAGNTQINPTSIEILERFTGTPEQAGDREWEWADRLGYPRGVHYKHTGNRGSRPEKLSKQITIRMSQDERAEIEALQAGETFQNTVRELVALGIAAKIERRAAGA
jgi:hypothetical protein